MNNQNANHKTSKKTEENNRKATNQEPLIEKPKTNKVSGPKLFNPPVIHDYEVKDVKSTRKKKSAKETNHFADKENLENPKKPHVIKEPLGSHKTGWIQNQTYEPEVEAPVDVELVDKFMALLEESSSIDDSTKKDEPFQSGPFIFNYDESSSLYESSSIDIDDTLYEESSSKQDESSSLFIESPSFEESPSMFEISLYEKSSFFDCESSSVDEYDQADAKQNALPIVKIPVVLSNVEIEIDIFDSFLLHLPIKEISKIDWSVLSLECQVPLPSQRLFVKGILLADIEYVENNESRSLQTVKMQVPFNKTIDVEWLTSPEVPRSHQAEYMYQECECIQLHQELTKQYAHPIQSDLKNIHIIWQNDFISDNGLLNVQGRVRLFVQLLQNQYIKLADSHL